MNEIMKGKVKTVFETSEPNEVLIQYDDKVTAGNGKKIDFPEGKGQVCCEISAFLFKRMEYAGIKNHYINMPTLTSMRCKKVKIIPIEVVVRNICSGSIVRQTTLEDGDNIPNSLVEWYLKDDEKDDPLLTTDRIILMGYGPLMLQEMGTVARDVNYILKNTFRKIGLTLVDFKLEFGYDADQNILLADELSPDGMRLWKQGTKESFDKDLFRKGEGDIVEAYKYILQELQRFS